MTEREPCERLTAYDDQTNLDDWATDVSE